MFTDYFAARGLDAYTDEDYFRYIDGKPRAEGIAAMLAARAWSCPPVTVRDRMRTTTTPPPTRRHRHRRRTRGRKNRIFTELLAEGIEAYPGSVAYIDALDAAGIAKCVVSSSRTLSRLTAAGLRDRSRIIVDGGSPPPRASPASRAPTRTCGRRTAGRPRDRCAVVEDAVSGVQAGAAGRFAHVIGVDRGAGRQTLLDEGRRRRRRPRDLIPGVTGEAPGTSVQTTEVEGERGRVPGPRPVRLPSASPCPATSAPPTASISAATSRPEINRSTHPVDPWRWVETSQGQPARVSETQFAVGNGYLGMRGNPGRAATRATTGRSSTASTRPGTSSTPRTPSGSHEADHGAGARHQDDPRLRRRRTPARHRRRPRALRTQHRLPRRCPAPRTRVRTPAGKKVIVRTSRMVSMVEKHLAVMTSR